MRPLPIILLLMYLFSGPGNLEYRLGIVNDKAGIKKAGSHQWVYVSIEDMGMPISTSDSVRVFEDCIYIKKFINGKSVKTYQADPGKWTVKDIINGKAYQTKREREEAGEVVRGNKDIYFDIIVDGRMTTDFRFGDHPSVRIINDSRERIYYIVIWGEGDNYWNMLSYEEAGKLEPKCSCFEETKPSFIIGPPSGKGEVYLVTSKVPFTFQEAISVMERQTGFMDFSLLFKKVIISD